jgi:hypothetical protein
MEFGKLKAMVDGRLKEFAAHAAGLEAQLRFRGEHPFHVIQTLSGHRKMRYCGLVVRTAQVHALVCTGQPGDRQDSLFGARQLGRVLRSAKDVKTAAIAAALHRNCPRQALHP